MSLLLSLSLLFLFLCFFCFFLSSSLSSIPGNLSHVFSLFLQGDRTTGRPVRATSLPPKSTAPTGQHASNENENKREDKSRWKTKQRRKTRTVQQGLIRLPLIACVPYARQHGKPLGGGAAQRAQSRRLTIERHPRTDHSSEKSEPEASRCSRMRCSGDMMERKTMLGGRSVTETKASRIGEAPLALLLARQ